VRGFKQDTLGPLGADGAPIGGNFQLILNAEMRVPLQYGFLAAAFVDAGSVWLWNQPTDGFDLRETAGSASGTSPRLDPSASITDGNWIHARGVRRGVELHDRHGVLIARNPPFQVMGIRGNFASCRREGTGAGEASRIVPGGGRALRSPGAVFLR